MRFLASTGSSPRNLFDLQGWKLDLDRPGRAPTPAVRARRG
jgi:hypothetical protein